MFYILQSYIGCTAQMGPPLCTRRKGTGYVDLRHVLFGDHTFGKFRRRSWLRLGCDLLRFVAICCDLLALCCNLLVLCCTFERTFERKERHVQHDPRPVKLVASTVG
jgi:hypothetical protein